MNSGKWLTPAVPYPHRCKTPYTVYERHAEYKPGSIWQCECGKKWRYDGEGYDGYSTYPSWTNLEREAQQKAEKEAKKARKAAVPWYFKPFVR